jgi:pyruvate formate lyase activating enzyme
MKANEVLKEILKDENFYRNSGGGVTFCGGEPLAQIDFLMALARLCKKNFIHTCVETCGNVSFTIMSRILPYIDIFLYDFKAMNPEKHQKYTGVSNKLILNNFKKLVTLGKEVIARIPIIPGLNDDEENYRMLIQFLSKNAPGVHINLLPYHRLGLSKYHLINKTYTLNNLKPPTAEKVKEIKKMLTNSGFDVSIGG